MKWTAYTVCTMYDACELDMQRNLLRRDAFTGCFWIAAI